MDRLTDTGTVRKQLPPTDRTTLAEAQKNYVKFKNRTKASAWEPFVSGRVNEVAEACGATAAATVTAVRNVS